METAIVSALALAFAVSQILLRMIQVALRWRTGPTS